MQRRLAAVLVATTLGALGFAGLTQAPPRGNAREADVRFVIVNDVVGSSHRSAVDVYWESDKLGEAISKLRKEGWSVVEVEGLLGDNLLLICRRSH